MDKTGERAIEKRCDSLTPGRIRGFTDRILKSIGIIEPEIKKPETRLDVPLEDPATLTPGILADRRAGLVSGEMIRRMGAVSKPLPRYAYSGHYKKHD